jgi:uncharacterized damage-inducible protein DinB
MNIMSQGKQETREAEVARVRSYLAGQSMRRTPVQLVEVLRDAHHQFLAATATISDANFRTPPQEGEWAAADVLAHVCKIAALEEQSIRTIIERGKQPAPISDSIVQAPVEATREALLAELDQSREQLFALVLQADPQAHLDTTWVYSDFGPMNWREWLLLARLHELDHVRQMQAIVTALSQ